MKIEMYKNFYEVSICIHPKGSPAEDDYESVEFVDADNYFDAIVPFRSRTFRSERLPSLYL